MEKTSRLLGLVPATIKPSLKKENKLFDKYFLNLYL
jgi:hypothetical protein